MRQYDVSDPFNPKFVGSVRIGGIAERTAHPNDPSKALNGGPQMVEISRDGKRVYFTNSLYRTWDDQFYPDGLKSWMVKVDVGNDGAMAFDPKFFIEFPRRASRPPSAAAGRRRILRFVLLLVER